MKKKEKTKKPVEKDEKKKAVSINEKSVKEKKVKSQEKKEAEEKKVVKDKKKSTTKNKQPFYYEGVGRRRASTARVRLYVVNESSVKIGENEIKKGEMVVNDRTIDKYFIGETYKKSYLEPFRTTNTMNRFAVSVRTRGGGLFGQLNAIVLGCARALEKIDKEKYRPILKKRGFLTRDPRVKERRKAGLAGKARAKKQSPKR